MEADGKEVEDGRVARLVQLRDARIQALRQARKQVERDDEERLVGLVVLRRVRAVVLELDERLPDDAHAALEDGLGVGDEALSDGDDD